MTEPVRRNRRGEQTRVELFEAGLRLMCTVPLDQLLSSISIAEICSEAGRTTGAFHHHFDDWETYVRGVVEHLTDILFNDMDGSIQSSFEHFRPDEFLEIVRTGAEWVWDPEDPRERFLTDSFAFVCGLGRRSVGAEPAFARQVFLDHYWELHRHHMTAMYSSLTEQSGREFLPPYTVDDFNCMAAVLEIGFRSIDAIGMFDVTAEHFGDAVLGLVAQMTRPVGRSYRFDDTVSVLYRGAPAVIEAGSELADVDWTRIADLFHADGDVSMSIIADVAGLGLTDAVRLLRTPRRTAALAAGSWMSDLASAGARRAEDPLLAIVDVVVELARSARSQRRVAASLLSERGSERLATDVRSPTAHELVPIDAVVAATLAQLPEGDPATSAWEASLVVDTTLLIASTRPGIAPADIAARALSTIGVATRIAE